MNAAKCPIKLTGPLTSRTLSAIVFGRILTVTLSVPLRVAFAVVAAVQAHRTSKTWSDDFDVPRARTGASTSKDFGGSWNVQRRAASHLAGLGLVKIVPRNLGATRICDHVVLTPMGIALVEQYAQARMEIEAVGLGPWTSKAASDPEAATVTEAREQ